jgi:GT2 family glycosyltransferase
MVNYNGLQDTLECLASLKSCTYPAFEVLLFDNGSSADQEEVLARYPLQNYRFVANHENLGFGVANNKGIEMVVQEGKAKYIYFLNNDTVVEPDFLAQAVAVAEQDPKTGIVASLSLQYAQRDLVENAGHEFLDCGDVVPRGRGKPKDYFTQSMEIMGACSANALYRVETLQESGGYDATFFLNYEDADLSLRCMLYGWKCVFAPQSIIYHKVSASIKKVRDYAFSLRSQQNALKTYYYNTPMAVLIANAPFVLLRDLLVIIINTLFFRWDIVRVFLHAKWNFFLMRKTVRLERATRMKKKKISSWYIWRHQKNFIPYYAGYFRDIILKNKKSVLETGR